MSIMQPLIGDLRDSWISLLRRPLRSGLSSLGIGIGVVALIAMLSISEGARKQTMQKIESLGVSTLRIEQKTVLQGELDSLINLSKGLSTTDEKTIRTWIGDRGLVGGFSRQENVSIRLDNKMVSGTLLGVSPQWFSAEDLHVEEGRLFNSDDVLSQSKYCVIGSELAKMVHAGLLSNIRFSGEVFTVVGITEKKGRLLTEGTGLSTLDFDQSVYVPKTTFIYEGTDQNEFSFDGIVVKIAGGKGKHLGEIGSQLNDLLLQNHRDVKDFTVVVPYQLLKEAQANQRIFSLVMGTIASLSLVVGGIGVLNVMLANIAEQTRDIGLRMAIGATKTRIICLYLCHSILLSLSGSIWGTAVGVFLSFMIQYYAKWPVAFSLISFLIAPIAAIVTGVLFGLHPALRAANLNPALALRDV